MSYGETVAISGMVRDMLDKPLVAMIITSPSGDVVLIQQLQVRSDRTFSSEYTTGSALMRDSGEYTITVSYGGNTRTASTVFEFSGIGNTPSPSPDPAPRSLGITDTTIRVGGADDLITYEMVGGSVLEAISNWDGRSIIFRIDATEDGVLIATVPRTVFDSVEDGDDADIFVLINGEEIFEGEMFEETTTRTDRTLKI